MRKNKLAIYIVVLTIIVALCFNTFSLCSSAVISRNGSISLSVVDSRTRKSIEGVVFRLYFFADAYEKNNGVGYNYVIPYDDCKMEITNLQDPYLAIHLSNFALTNNLSYTQKTSGANGKILFDNLKPGVYLLFATEIDENYFMPSPFVINIPSYNQQEKIWKYDIEATPKMQILSADDYEKTTYIKVKKQWKTNEEVPHSVSVSLLRDLQVVETVELNAENNWSHRWNHLSKKHTWSVVETVVADGYKVSYDFSDNTVIITNTKDGYNDKTPSDTTVPETTEKNPATDETPTDTPPTKPTDTPESTTKPEELIDTGQLNWPVPVFSIAGLLLFSIGYMMLNFGKKDEETL